MFKSFFEHVFGHSQGLFSRCLGPFPCTSYWGTGHGTADLWHHISKLVYSTLPNTEGCSRRRKNAALIWVFSKPGPPLPPPQVILESFGHFSVGWFFFGAFCYFCVSYFTKDKGKKCPKTFGFGQPPHPFYPNSQIVGFQKNPQNFLFRFGPPPPPYGRNPWLNYIFWGESSLSEKHGLYVMWIRVCVVEGPEFKRFIYSYKLFQCSNSMVFHCSGIWWYLYPN